MNLYRSVALIVLLSTLFSAACGKAATPSSSSSAGALTANSSFNPVPAKSFGRHTLNSAGSNYLNEFIRPEVRARLDEEPVGDTDGGYEPGASEAASSDQSQEEPAAEAQNEEQPQNAQPGSEESYPAGSRLDTLKFSWARKAFGDAVKASPTNTGVIVLYADENYYDVERLTAFIEEGRHKVAEMSGVGDERIQVLFGGYRGVAQVELWVVPQGSSMPEFKPDARPKTGQPGD
jgi:hypothetical protein